MFYSIYCTSITCVYTCMYIYIYVYTISRYMKIRVHQDISRYIKIYYCKFHPHICCWYPPNLALQPSPWHLVVGRAAQGLGDGLAISPSGANILSSHHLHWGLRQIVKSSCPCSWMSNFICNQINGFPWSL